MSNLLEQASLVMIPSGYKEDIVYSEIPIDGSGDLQLTRASNGTRVNSAGLVEVVPWNLVQQSNAFSTSPWSKSAGTTLTSGQTDPNGGTTAFTLQMSSASNFLASGIFTVVSGSIYTYTIYIKSNTGSNQSFRIIDGVRGVAGGVLNGTATTSWQRVELQITPNSTSGAFQLDNAGGAYSNDLLICFSQANIGSTAKPYFPTTDRLNVPRLTYQNGGGGCPSLLLEKQSTNLLSYSQDFTQASWSKLGQGVGSASVVTANYAISPDGTQNATRFVCNLNGGTTSSDRSWMIASFTAPATSTLSIWIKLNSAGTKTFVFSDSGGDTKTISGTDWQRIDATFVGAGGEFRIGLIGGSSSDTLDCSIWGAQTEASSYPTSYIPTTSSSATRVADAPLNLSTTQTLTNFTLFWDGLIFDNGDTMFFGSGDAAWYLDINASINRVVLDLASGRKYSATSASLTPNQRFKLAVKRSGGVTDVFVNGTKLTPTIQVTDTTSLTLSSITWGFSSTYYPKMKVNEICAFQVALTDAECQSLTTI